jgi:squalene-associated FAD-dependent desaturase
VIGAGLAGLGAAVALTRAGFGVMLSEAAGQAGGRCRSYHDSRLGLTIDNGNHLVLAGNRAVTAYLHAIGAGDRLIGPEHAEFDFVDVRGGARWRLRINDGRAPWWILSRTRRVPDTRARDYLALRHLLSARGSATVASLMPASAALRRGLLEPLLIAALNTPLETASASLAATILRETIGAGGAACAPRIATPTLAAAFVDPAIAWLERQGMRARLGRRLRAIELANDRITALIFTDGTEPVASGEPVILAVPAWAATELVPGLVAPDRHHAILNAHFAAAAPAGAVPIVGVIGGTAEWVFAHPDRLSVTVSAADALCEADRDALAATIWREVAAVHGLAEALPPWRILCEKRATFAATPEQERLRPEAATRWRNLFLAGDWTATGLPATIEGALRSGDRAAALAAGTA